MWLELKSRVQVVEDEGALYLRLLHDFAKFEPVDDNIRALIRALFRGGTEERILSSLGLGEGSVRTRFSDYIQTLRERGFIAIAGGHSDLSTHELTRYDRQLRYLSALETGDRSRFDIMNDIVKAKVAILGLGGLGNWVLACLASLGVKNYTLLDPDIVELSNLNRTILFAPHHVGQPKTMAAAEFIARFSPDALIDQHRIAVDGPTTIAQVVKGHDLVISQLDKPIPEIQLWVTAGCRKVKAALLLASSLRVGPFYVSDAQPCIQCYYSAAAEGIALKASGPVKLRNVDPDYPRVEASIVSSASITAGVVCQEVVRYFSKTVRPLTFEGIWQMSERDLSAAVKPIGKRVDCPLCSAEDTSTN